MGRSERHWRKVEAHLRRWAADLDKAKVRAEADVAKIQTEYYQHLAGLRADIEQTLKRWGTEWKTLHDHAGPAETEAARSLAEFRDRIQAELTAWRPELERLKTTVAKTNAEAKRVAHELRAKGTRASQTLAGLRRTAGASWDEIKPGIERAWAELRPALRKAAAKFREPRPADIHANSEGSQGESQPEPPGTHKGSTEPPARFHGSL
jgi:ElaB/YqjD/DUF883 family membrane-anchored ribosome-binding protein